MILQSKLDLEKDAHTVFEKLDVDQNAKIQAAEFCAYLRKRNVPPALVSDAQINYLFRKFSACDAAVLTSTEFRALLGAETTSAAKLSAQRRISEFSRTNAEERLQFAPETTRKEERASEERIQYSKEELMHAFSNALSARAQNRYASFGRAFKDAVDEGGKATRNSVRAFVRKMLPEVNDKQI